MSESTRNASVATLATASVRQANYTDARYTELSARLDALQVDYRRSEARESRHLRMVTADRTGAIALSAIVALCIGSATSLPHVLVIILGATPEILRELVEFLIER